MAKGLDCGTSFYIAATEDSIKKQRNAFLTVDGDVNQVKRMLKRQRIPFVEKSGKVHIVGEHAFNYAQIFGSAELRRPMKSGLLNPQERDALPILNAIVGELLNGKSKKKGEVVTYCIPAAPIDQDRRVDYHEDVLKAIIEGFEYKARPIGEAVALAYEGLVDNINQAVSGVVANLNSDNTITLSNTTGSSIIVAGTGSSDVGFTNGTFTGFVSLQRRPVIARPSHHYQRRRRRGTTRGSRLD